MNQGPISVNHKALEAAVEAMVLKAQRIKDVLDNLDTDIRNDVNQWGGQAKVAYFDAKRNWDEQLNQMIAHLGTAAQGVNDANVAYRNTDSKNASLFQDIRPV